MIFRRESSSKGGKGKYTYVIGYKEKKSSATGLILEVLVRTHELKALLSEKF